MALKLGLNLNKLRGIVIDLLKVSPDSELFKVLYGYEAAEIHVSISGQTEGTEDTSSRRLQAKPKPT